MKIPDICKVCLHCPRVITDKCHRDVDMSRVGRKCKYQQLDRVSINKIKKWLKDVGER